MANSEPLLSPLYSSSLAADLLEEGNANGGGENGSRAFSALGKDAKKRLETVLQWNGIRVKVNGGKKEILHGMSGSARPGEVVVILGSSGAGKSTLLNVLAGRVMDGLEGSIEMNGVPVSPEKLRRHVAYVEQEDALFPTQSPREALEFAAALKLSCSGTEREELVSSMIETLRLGRCQNTMIGSKMIRGVSGGEKKRAAIGIELISNPDVILLDECTSGLDSYSSLMVIKVLRRLAQDGCTVICTIHQPGSELFELFDRTILLANGRTVFHGPTTEMLAFFAAKSLNCPPHYNPADFVMFETQLMEYAKLEEFCDSFERDMQPKQIEDVESLVTSLRKQHAAGGGRGGAGAAAGERISHSIYGDDGYVLELSKKRAILPVQMYWLAQREFQNVRRDRGGLIARFAGTILINLIVGLVFKGVGYWPSDESIIAAGPGAPQLIATSIGNHYGGLTQLAVSALFGLAQPMLLAFPTEKPVFLREYATHTYSAFPYFVSKFLVEMPMALIQSAVSFVVTYWLVGLQGEFVELVCIAALLGLTAASTSLVISAAAPNVTVAIQLSPFLFVPQILFSGVFITIDTIPHFMRWAQYLCSLKYALNLMTLVEFRSVPELVSPGVDVFLASQDISKSNELIYSALLLAVFFVFRLSACVILTIKGSRLS